MKKVLSFPALLVISVLLAGCAAGNEEKETSAGIQTEDVGDSQNSNSGEGANLESTDEQQLQGVADCGPDAEAREIPPEEFFGLLEEQYESRFESPYSYTSSAGEVARIGPFNYWLAENTTEFMSSVAPEPFDTVSYAGWEIRWEQFVTLQGSLCDYREGKANLRTVRLALDSIFEENEETRWPGHAANWPTFPYIETGPEVIPANAPKGLEHYTQYIAGGGVIIVAGDEVDPEALLAARDSVEYMTSARPEFRQLLEDYHVRISLFMDSTSTLPDFAGTDEPGGFAMGMNDAAMTANAEWICYAGNGDPGGNPVIHELAHTLEHIVFDHTNDTDFFSQITPLALAAIEEGYYGHFEQTLEEGTEQDTSHLVGEYWAQVVEGYIMDGGPDFKYSHYSRDWIKKNDPGVFELLTDYFPTEEWDYVGTYCRD